MFFILVLNETEQKSDLIILNPNMNVAIKRKSRGIEKNSLFFSFSLFKYRIGHASLSFAKTTEKYLSSWISNKNDGEL
jgi:hypothetical protein